MKDVRGAVLCNSCAADSSKFFTDNGKASLHLSTCREMISICSDFFRQILSLLTGFGELKVQLDSLELGSIPMSNKLKILKSELDIIAIETKNHPILSHFKALDKPDNNSSTEESQKSICNSLYVFNDLTFIEKIKPLMVNTCYRMDEIIKGIKEYQEMKIMQSRSLKLNQFQPESRSLFQIESENTTEVDPILPTSNNDNIFKSDDSDLQKVFSTDSSVQPSPSDKVAMNCTFSFP